MLRKGTDLLVLAIILALLLGAPSPAAAQQGDDAIRPVNAAIQALNQTYPGIGQPLRYEFTFAAPTVDSSLGCPLVRGIELDERAVPYRINLFYDDAQYTYHVSGDGSIVIPCDPQLPIGGGVPPGEEPFAPESPVVAAVNTYIEMFPERGFPDRYDFTFYPATTDSSLGCPLVEGNSLSEAVVPYRVTLYENDVPHVIYVSGDASIVIPCDPQLRR